MCVCVRAYIYKGKKKQRKRENDRYCVATQRLKSLKFEDISRRQSHPGKIYRSRGDRSRGDVNGSFLIRSENSTKSTLY